MVQVRMVEVDYCPVNCKVTRQPSVLNVWIYVAKNSGLVGSNRYIVHLFCEGHNRLELGLELANPIYYTLSQC